jgi:hypothetical protein
VRLGDGPRSGASEPHASSSLREIRLPVGVCPHRHHYWRHNWLEDGILLGEASRLSGIPGVLIHGRWDLGGPLVTPWRPAQHWPGSEFVIVSEAGRSRHERRGSRRYGSLCGRHITFHPLQDQWDEHFERNGVLVFGRNAVGRATVGLLRMNGFLRSSNIASSSNLLGERTPPGLHEPDNFSTFVSPPPFSCLSIR